MENQPECEQCGETFDPQRAALGYRICIPCAEKTVKRYLGRRGGETKTDGCYIYRENLDWVQKVLKRENAVGFNANLPVSSPIAVQNFQGKIEERNRK